MVVFLKGFMQKLSSPAFKERINDHILGAHVLKTQQYLPAFILLSLSHLLPPLF